MYHYRECGLSNVWLANGYEWVPTSLGKAFRVRSADELEKVIERAVVAKPGPLTGQEFRYLRKSLHLSQCDLAKMLGNNEQTIALWEKRRGPPLWADRLIRAFNSEAAGKALSLRKVFASGQAVGHAGQKAASRLIFEKRARGGWHHVSSSLAKAA